MIPLIRRTDNGNWSVPGSAIRCTEDVDCRDMVPSLIAWLDADTDDQARMREIVKLFTDRDSRDELGLGQVRDAISDGLFPGTSVLLTRARYLLLVPWCYGRPGTMT